jgi:hypothetical protein
MSDETELKRKFEQASAAFAQLGAAQLKVKEKFAELSQSQHDYRLYSRLLREYRDVQREWDLAFREFKAGHREFIRTAVISARWLEATFQRLEARKPGGQDNTQSTG